MVTRVIAIAIIIYLFILLIFYSADYVILEWSEESVRLYRDICNIFGSTPYIMKPGIGGGSIWKNLRADPYIKQLAIVEGVSTSLQLQIRLALFAGYGNINITESEYNKRMGKILSMSPEGLCTYDPLSQSLYIKNIKGSLYDLLDLARKCARSTEAFPARHASTNPRAELQAYHKKYFTPRAPLTRASS
jgi:hypothetical protein